MYTAKYCSIPEVKLYVMLLPYQSLYAGSR